MSETAVVLAHQGGWDEIAMVAAPLALLANVCQKYSKIEA